MVPRWGQQHDRKSVIIDGLKNMTAYTPRPFVLIATLLGMSIAWSGCSRQEAAQPEPVVAVQVAPAEQQTIIVPKISAPIEKFYVTRGSHVHAGELLALLENKDLSAAVVQSQGAYDQAQAAYVTATQVNLPADIQTARLNVQATREAMQADQLVYESRLKL